MKQKNYNNLRFFIIELDGWNVGILGAFAKTVLNFTTYKEAYDIAKHWAKWSQK